MQRRVVYTATTLSINCRYQLRFDITIRRICGLIFSIIFSELFILIDVRKQMHQIIQVPDAIGQRSDTEIFRCIRLETEHLPG